MALAFASRAFRFGTRAPVHTRVATQQLNTRDDFAAIYHVLDKLLDSLP